MAPAGGRSSKKEIESTMKRSGTLRCAGLGLAAMAFVALSGCGYYAAPVKPPQGAFYSSIKAPMDTDAETTSMGSRSGMASSVSLLSLFAFGDASTSAAAAQGGLSEVTHVDYEYFNLLGIYQKFTTIVRGN
jgi:hypothetical protein